MRATDRGPRSGAVLGSTWRCYRLPELNGLGRMLILAGVLLVVVGVLVGVLGRVPWLGRLPGDIVIQRGNFTFYAPVATMLLLSLILTILLRLFRR